MKLFELFATLSLETKEFVRGVNTAGKQAQGLAANVQNKVSAATVAIGNLAARGVEKVAQAGVKVVRDSLDVVKEFEQNLGGSEAVFGQWADTVQKMGSTAYKTMGLSLSDYLSTANQMGSLFKGAGYTTSEAMDMTTKAMQRAADVASIMGIDAEWAMESVAGLAKGNFTMMDNLGVAINDTTLANYALEKGIKKSTSAMSTQEKVALALELFLERTAEYAGNYAKENNTLAGSYEVVAAAYENMLIGQEGSTEAFVDAVGIAAKATLKNLGEIIPRLGRSMQIALQKAGPEIKKELSQWGTVAYEKGAEIVSQTYNGITGAKTTAEDVKNAVKELFDFSGIVVTGISDTAYSAYEWFRENGTAVSSSLSLIALGMGAFSLAGHPFALAVGSVSAAIVAFSTDWDTIKEKFPVVISTFENLTGIDFDTFVEGVKSAKQPIADFVSAAGGVFFEGLAWLNDNGVGVATAVTTIAGSFAKWLLVAHPLATTLTGFVSLLGFFKTEGQKVRESSFKEYITDQYAGVSLYTDQEIAVLQEYINAKRAYEEAISSLGIGPPTNETETRIQNLKSQVDKLYKELRPSESWLNADILDAYENWLNEKHLAGEEGLLDVLVEVSDDSETNIQTSLDSMSLDAIVKLIPDSSFVQNAINAFNSTAKSNIPGYATGISSVPYDNFLAYLHKGEAILPRAEAENWRNGEISLGGTTKLESLIGTLIEEVKGLSNMTIAMDSVAVGHMVMPTVSKDIALQSKSKRYGK